MINNKELDFMQAKEKALRLLEFRSHSKKELFDKLKRAGAKEEDIESVMEFLTEYGFLNDAEYAKRLAHDLKNLKKYGKRRIRDELRVRGISGEELDEALDEIPEDEQDELLPLMEKKLGGNFEKKNTDKAIRYFLYRGYEFNDIKSCIDKIKAEQIYD